MHKLRGEVMEDLQGIHIADSVGIEVDQTGMELHERCSRKVCPEGLLTPWMNLFSKIKPMIFDIAQINGAFHDYRALSFDVQGMGHKRQSGNHEGRGHQEGRLTLPGLPHDQRLASISEPVHGRGTTPGPPGTTARPSQWALSK